MCAESCAEIIARDGSDAVASAGDADGALPDVTWLTTTFGASSIVSTAAVGFYEFPDKYRVGGGELSTGEEHQKKERD